MAEAEEIQSRIETIKDLSDRLAEQDRTIKDLEEEMRSETPEHPWSFMKMRRHNRLHAEIEDERTSMSRDRYDLNRLTERLFEDVNIIADKATSTNSLELILDLVEQSLDTDPKYRESVRKQAGVTDGMSYMRLVPQDNPQGMLPPTPWGRKAAEEAYRQHQVRQLDPRLRLLRTLATGSCKDHDTPETNDYLALMDFNVGDQVTMGPGLSTTVTTPHWLGAGESSSSSKAPPTECRWSAAGETCPTKARCSSRTYCTAPFWKRRRTAPIWARDSNESTGSASIRRRLPFRNGNFWNSQASNRMFRCRTRPSTRTRRPADRTIQDLNHENKRNKRKPT